MSALKNVINEDSKTEDILKTKGVNANGYGIIPKLVVKDKRLTRDAKAIYAYFCSYAGRGNSAFPTVKQICNDLNFKNEDTYRKHRKLLEKYDYLHVTQEKSEDGKFMRNIYTLIQNPSPETQENRKNNTDTQNLSVGSSDTQSSGGGFFRERENWGINNNNDIKNNNRNNNIYQSINNAKGKKKTGEYGLIDVKKSKEKNRETYRSIISENIEYDALKEKYDTSNEGQIDEILDILVETVSSQRKRIKVNGEELTMDVVRSRLLKLDQGHIEYVMECFNNTSTKVKNIKSYLLTALFNAPLTINTYYSNQVNHDMKYHGLW